jgi:hypothetical protein
MACDAKILMVRAKVSPRGSLCAQVGRAAWRHVEEKGTLGSTSKNTTLKDPENPGELSNGGSDILLNDLLDTRLYRVFMISEFTRESASIADYISIGIRIIDS